MSDLVERLREQIEALPENHINFTDAEGEYDEHTYVVKKQAVLDIIAALDAQPVGLAEQVMRNWDRYREHFTEEQNRAVAAVLFLSDAKPSDQRMEHYRQLAVEHGWIASALASEPQP